MQSTTQIIPFEFESRAIRVTIIDSDPWFVAIDVCKAIGIKNSRDALSKLDADEKGVALTDTLGGQQELATINESGLYTLILRSRNATKPGSPQHRFRKWVTAEVLPSIRKYGYYQERENQLQPALAIHYPMAAWPEINPQLKRDWAKDLPSIVPNRHWVKARHLHGESAPSPTMRLLIQLKNAGFDVSCCEAEVLAMRHHIEMSESTRCEIERLMGRTHNLPVTA